jgi:hypothetical protein
MVACALRDEPGGLAALVRAFADGADGTGLLYSLPPLAEPRSLRACANLLLE